VVDHIGIRKADQRSSTTELTIRRATAADSAVLAELIVLMYESMSLDVSDREWQAALPAWYERRFSTQPDTFAAFVATSGDRIGGGCTAWTLDSLPRPGSSPSGRRGYVAGMYVHSDWRGHGVARQLLSAALDWCRTAGCDLAELHATKMGAPLYETVGFESTAAYRLSLS
jgi:GNAT superfamily N-acetyltransferase